MDGDEDVTQTTTSGFDEEALAALPATAPFVEALRKQAFAEYLAFRSRRRRRRSGDIRIWRTSTSTFGRSPRVADPRP